MAIDFKKLMFGKKVNKKELVADFHTTIIKVDDNFISSSSIMLDEKLLGNIFSLKEVDIAAVSEVSGNIISRTSIISGKVSGDIRATEFVQVKSTATITGNILASSILIESGAIINGSIRIDGAIDERDLIEKVENRLKLNLQVGNSSTPLLIEEQKQANSKK
jgi:cytoskeletal protein CcmA (bactofilin family)